MNKLITKIVGAALGLTMTVGVGVAVGVNAKSDIVPAEAANQSVTLNVSSSGVSDWGSNAYGSGALRTATVGTITLNGHYLTRNPKNTPSGASANTYIVGQKNNATLYNATPLGSKIVSIVVNQASTARAWTLYVGNTQLFSDTNTSQAQTPSGTAVSSPSTAATMTWNSTQITGNYKYFCLKLSNSGASYISSVVITYEPAGADTPTVSSVSVTGDMTTKSYTTVQSWNNAGLTANVTMSDSSSYTGSIDWSYSPTSPAAYALSNNGEVTSGTVRATASADDKSGYKDVTGISVNYATVSQALAVIPTAGVSVANSIVKGTVSRIDSIDTGSYGNATYYISADGTTSNELEVYRGYGLNNAHFTNTNDLLVGDQVVVYGTLTNYSGTKEFTTGSYLLDLVRPETGDPSITIDQANFNMNVGDADVVLTATAENIPDGGSVKWESGTPAVATVGESTGSVHAVSAGTATITAKIVDSGSTTVASNSITVSVFESIVKVGDLVYFSVSYDSTTYYLCALGGNDSSSTTEGDKVVFTVESGSSSGSYALRSGELYLKCTGSSPYLGSGSEIDATTSWTIVNDGTNDIITNVNTPTRKLMWNYNTGSPRFGSYTSASATIVYADVTVINVPDPTTLTLNTHAITVGQGETSSTLTFTSDSPSAAFNWYSEDGSKATVSNGVVTGVADNGTVKIYVWFDTDGSGDFDPLEDLNDYCTVTLTTPSIDYASKTYGGVGTLITSLSGLTVGDKIAITNVDDDALAGTTIVSNTIRLSSASFSISNSKLVIGDGSEEIDALILTVDTYNSSTGAITLKHGAKWLSSTAVKKANFADEAFTWTLSFSSSIPVLTSSIDGGGHLQYNYNNGSDPRFIPYTSAQTAIHLWNVETYSDAAENYANSFLNSGVCGSNDNTKADSTIWGQQRTAYLALSSGAQYLLSHATANAGSTDDIQKCLAKYDRVIYLHYSAEPTSYPDFMNRVANNFVTPLANGASSFLTNNNDAATATVIVIVMFSATALGTFFFLRRRKERN